MSTIFDPAIYDSYTQAMLWIIFGIGVPYAIGIAFRPFPDGWTWLSVVIGTSFTIIPVMFAVYHHTGSLALASLPAIGFIISGTPMIIGQAGKHLYYHIQYKRKNNGDYLERSK